MNTNVSLCTALQLPNVRAVEQQDPRSQQRVIPVNEDRDEDNPVLSGLNCNYKRHGDNLALGSLDFTYVPSQMIPHGTKQIPTVGDLCVSLAPLTARNDEYASIVDLYNTYCVKGSAQMAVRCMNSYVSRRKPLYVPAIPICVFVSEWNRSLGQFHDMVRCTEETQQASTRCERRRIRASVVANVTALALENIPTRSEHLWLILHCLVSKPSLVREAVRLVGSIASFSSSSYHTGEVDNIKVFPDGSSFGSSRLYLIAKSTLSASGNDVTALGGEAGASLGLVWTNGEEELFDHLRNAPNSYYVHLGTEAGGTFRCNGFCEWRRYDPTVYERMGAVGMHVVRRIASAETGLAGDTADSARAIARRL